MFIEMDKQEFLKDALYFHMRNRTWEVSLKAPWIGFLHTGNKFMESYLFCYFDSGGSSYS